MGLKLDAISINFPHKCRSVIKVIDRYMHPRHVAEKKSCKKFQLLILHHFKEKLSLAVVPYPNARLNHGSCTLTILLQYTAKAETQSFETNKHKICISRMNQQLFIASQYLISTVTTSDCHSSGKVLALVKT